jgi:hypothetical protein
MVTLLVGFFNALTNIFQILSIGLGDLNILLNDP